MKKITLIGSFSGRNAGDAAILGNLLDDFAETRRDIEFLVPTILPAFVKKQFGHHNVRAMGMMPWHGSLKALGLANYIAMTRTDMVLITDNAFFDRKLYNPLINTLWSVALFSPICKKRNIPIVFHNASVGPIETEAGKKALQKVVDATKLITLRDKQTQELFERLQIDSPEIHIKADCAIDTTPSDKRRLDEIIRKENLFTNPNGTISFNVNAYIDNWSNRGKLTREDFCRIIAESIDTLIENLAVDVLLVVTQVMDLKITKECFAYINNTSNVRIVTNEEYSYQDIVGILSNVGSHIGLRTHSLIFSAAVNTPMVSINSYPKNAGFMRSIAQDNWMVDFTALDRDTIVKIMTKSWQEREQRKNHLQPIVDVEKKKAKESVQLVNELLNHMAS